jgi:hypothetical protein
MANPPAASSENGWMTLGPQIEVFIGHDHARAVGYRRSPGHPLLPRSTRIRSIRMPLWSALVARYRQSVISVPCTVGSLAVCLARHVPCAERSARAMPATRKDLCRPRSRSRLPGAPCQRHTGGAAAANPAYPAALPRLTGGSRTG